MSTPSLMDLIKSKKAALNSGKREKTIKPKDGRNRYRVLPGWRLVLDPATKDYTGDQTFYHDFGQHFIKDETNTLKAVYLCTDKTFGKPCEVCNTIDKAIHSSSDDAMVKLMKEAKASGRILLNVLELTTGAENPTEPQILELAPSAFNDVLNLFYEHDDITDLDTGKDIIIERSGKGIGTRYSIQVAGKSVAVPKETMKRLKNLDEYVAQESAEQAARAIANVKSIAGLLPSEYSPRPAAAARLAAPSMDIDDEPDVTLLVDDAPKTAPAVKRAAPAAAVAESTGDEELDALLADL